MPADLDDTIKFEIITQTNAGFDAYSCVLDMNEFGKSIGAKVTELPGRFEFEFEDGRTETAEVCTIRNNTSNSLPIELKWAFPISMRKSVESYQLPKEKNDLYSFLRQLKAGIYGFMYGSLSAAIGIFAGEALNELLINNINIPTTFEDMDSNEKLKGTISPYFNPFIINNTLGGLAASLLAPAFRYFDKSAYHTDMEYGRMILGAAMGIGFINGVYASKYYIVDFVPKLMQQVF